MLHILLGTDWTQNRAEILRRITSDADNGRDHRILMVPELISHDMERRLSSAVGDRCSRIAEVLSFTRLAGRVADRVGYAEPCLDNGGRVVAMAAAVRQLSSRLKAYASVETKPEFLTELVDAVDEFKRCCISPADLMEASGRAEGSLAQKLEELSLILEAYDGLCRQGKRDPRDQMTWLLEQLESCDFAEQHVFYIDGFPDFTRQNMAILFHLIESSPEVTISLNTDAVGSEAMAFEKAGQTARDFVQFAMRKAVAYDIQVLPSGNSRLEPMRNRLFQGKIRWNPDLVPRVHAVRANSVYEECTQTAEQILELVRGGSRYRDISVVCTDMGIYRSVINLVFHRCGIPVYMSGTDDILEKGVVATVLTALDAAIGGFDQREMFRYLRSVLSPLDPDTCDLVENYAVIWGIRSNRWTQEWKNHPDGLGEEWTEEAQKRLAALNEARRRAVDPLANLRRSFLAARNLSEQVLALYDFLEEIHLADSLGEMADYLDEAGDNRSAQELNQLWEILISAFEQMYDVLGQTVWDADSFTRLFRLLLSQYDVGTIPTVLDAVTAGPVTAMRCQEEKHLFVLGAVEGSLPSYSGSTGVLTDQERVALRKLGVPLTGGAMEGLQAEFAEIYGVFCGAQETVTVSCPGGQPSFVYRRILDMTGQEDPAEAELGPALTDENEAGAYLARWEEKDAAERLNLTQAYEDTRKKVSYDLGTVDREHVKDLYGTTLRLSASQIDQMAECRLAYFLKYGIRAKERREVTVDPTEFGTYVHAVLENTARAVGELGGFREVSLEKTMEIARKYADEYSAGRFSELDSRRTAYLLRRNQQELEMVVRELWDELQMSQFRPVGYEVAFGDGREMEAIGIPGHTMRAQLRGFVDRVDAWSGPEGNFFRVVDYKTGQKDFDYCDIFNGVGLQMLLYLFALQEKGQKIVGVRPIPAGVQYFPARAPVLSEDGRLDEEKALSERLKAWKRRGLLLNEESVLQAMEPGEKPLRMDYSRRKDGSVKGDLADRDQMKLLKKYIFQVLGKMVDEIASGKVAPNPYTRGTSHNACTFCPYAGICHKETVEGRRNYKAISDQKFWEDVENEVKRNG